VGFVFALLVFRTLKTYRKTPGEPSDVHRSRIPCPARLRLSTTKNSIAIGQPISTARRGIGDKPGNENRMLAARFVNGLCVDKLGWPPGLSASRLLTNCAANPPLTHSPRTRGNMIGLCREDTGNAAEFVNGRSVDKLGWSPSLSTSRLLTNWVNHQPLAQ
jgi:hypothetical protein